MLFQDTIFFFAVSA